MRDTASDITYKGHVYCPHIETFGDKTLICVYSHWVVVPGNFKFIAPFSVSETISPKSFRAWVDMELIEPDELYGFKDRVYTNDSILRINMFRKLHNFQNVDSMLVWIKLAQPFSDWEQTF